jgi:hypothetical protein
MYAHTASVEDINGAGYGRRASATWTVSSVYRNIFEVVGTYCSRVFPSLVILPL